MENSSAKIMEYEQTSAIFPSAIKIQNPREQNIFQVHVRTLTPLHAILGALCRRGNVNLTTRY